MRGDDETNGSDDRDVGRDSAPSRDELTRNEAPYSEGPGGGGSRPESGARSEGERERSVRGTDEEPNERRRGGDEPWRLGGEREGRGRRVEGDDESPRRDEDRADEGDDRPSERRSRSYDDDETRERGDDEPRAEGEGAETQDRPARQGRGPRGPLPRGRRGRGRDENRGGGRFSGRDNGGRGGRGGSRRGAAEDRPPEDEDLDDELNDSDLDDENGERRSDDQLLEHDDPLGGAFDLERGTPISTVSVQDAPPVQARAKMKAPKEFFNSEIVYRFDILEDLDRDALRGRYRLELKGYQGGVWTVLIDDALEVVNRREDADIVLTMQQRDFLHLVNGALNPQLALFAQKVRITGDLKRALAFQAILVPSSDY